MEHLKSAGYAPVNGLNMYYEIHGEGQMPLVLIHGGGSTIETSFGNTLSLFAAHYKVIAVELQAHGRTQDRDIPETFEQDADDVAALLVYLNIEKANILGFSNGGTTALQLAIRHAHLVHKVIAIAAIYQREGLIAGFFEGLEAASLSNMPAPLIDAYLKVNNSREGLLAMFNRDKQRMIDFKNIADNDLASIKAPTLLMVADKDVVSCEHTLKMSRLIPDAQLVVLPGIHGSFLGEVCTIQTGSKYPEITVAIITEFLT